MYKGTQDSTAMPECLICGAETQLYSAETPICQECDDRSAANYKPSRSHQPQQATLTKIRRWTRGSARICDREQLQPQHDFSHSTLSPYPPIALGCGESPDESKFGLPRFRVSYKRQNECVCDPGGESLTLRAGASQPCRKNESEHSYRSAF
jgi:hypothetical protein